MNNIRDRQLHNTKWFSPTTLQNEPQAHNLFTGNCFQAFESTYASFHMDSPIQSLVPYTGDATEGSFVSSTVAPSDLHPAKDVSAHEDSLICPTPNHSGTPPYDGRVRDDGGNFIPTDSLQDPNAIPSHSNNNGPASPAISLVRKSIVPQRKAGPPTPLGTEPTRMSPKLLQLSDPSLVRKSRFHCEICHKEFDRASRLDGCRNKHLGIKPYQCKGDCSSSGCSKSYCSADLLQRHIQPLGRCTLW